MINDINEDFELVWDVLQEYREETEGVKSNDRRWDKLCGAMARIREATNELDPDHEEYNHGREMEDDPDQYESDYSVRSYIYGDGKQQ